MFYVLMMLMKFSFVPQHFFRFFFFRIGIRIRISLSKSITKVMLCVLKIPTTFGVVPQIFFQNQNPVQDQDQDVTFDFNTRPIFHTQKTPTKFYLDPLTPSKIIVSTAKVHVRTYSKTTRQTDGNFFFLLVLSFKTYKT